MIGLHYDNDGMSAVQKSIKRGFDIVASFVVLVLLCPFWKIKRDEIMLLLNVLKGKMSIVGPEILTDDICSKNAIAAEYREWMNDVKPGLISESRVYLPAGERLSERILMDMIYIRKRSVQMDACIIYDFIISKITGLLKR